MSVFASVSFTKNYYCFFFLGNVGLHDINNCSEIEIQRGPIIYLSICTTFEEIFISYLNLQLQLYAHVGLNIAVLYDISGFWLLCVGGRGDNVGAQVGPCVELNHRDLFLICQTNSATKPMQHTQS